MTGMRCESTVKADRTLYRTRWVRRCAAPAVAALSALAGCAAHHANGTATFRQPAEFEPQAAVWICPDPDNPEYAPAHAEMIRALSAHVRVNILMRDDISAERARAQLRREGVPDDSATWFVGPLATTFIRDGAVFLVNGTGQNAVLDLGWSTYGLDEWCQRLHAGDPGAIAECSKYADVEQDGMDRWFARTIGATVVPTPLRLENAAFEVNGAGVLLVSEPLAMGRNLGWSKAQVEAALLNIPGVKKVIWLGAGLAEDPLEISTITGRYIGLGANGHTDEFVRFADTRTVLLAWVDERRAQEHPVARLNRERMLRNYQILSTATDQEGRPFRILRVPMPTVIERTVTLAAADRATDAWNEASFPRSEGRKAGEEVVHVAPASYLNFLIANELVLLPSFIEDGTPVEVEDAARTTFETAFPGRTVKFIRCTPLLWHGGGLHCASLSQPN